MPPTLNLPAASLLQGQVLNASTTAPVPGSATMAQKNCLKLVSPSTVLTNAYPIVSVTCLNAYYSGNGAAKVAALRGLFKLFCGTANAPVLPLGYSCLSGNAVFRISLSTAINNCIN